MKQNKTRIHCVLDRSGSMQPIIEASIEGINKFVLEQKDIKDQECEISVDIFDTVVETIRPKMLIENYIDITANEYVPRGLTSLYDAIGMGIDNLGKELAELVEEERPERVFFVILTDGAENSSSRYKFETISEMIKHQTEVYSWNFIFLAANQDAFNVGASMNIKSNAQFYGTSSSTRCGYAATATMVKSLRSMSKTDFDKMTYSSNSLYDLTQTSSDFKDDENKS